MKTCFLMISFAVVSWGQQGTVELTVQPLAPDTGPQYATPRDSAIAAFQAAWKELLDTKDAKKAAQGWQTASALDPSYGPALFDLALLAEREGHWSDALRLYQGAAGSQDAQLATQAKHELERVKLAAALEATPEGARKRRCDVAMVTASAVPPAGDAQRAINAWAEASRIDPARWEPSAGIAAILLERRLFGDAQRFLEAAVRHAPSDKSAPLKTALERARRESDWATAVAQARSLWDAAEYTKAAAAYRDAYRLFPQRENAGLRLAGAQLAIDDLPQATTTLVALRDGGPPEQSLKARQMLKELAAVYPAARAESERAASALPIAARDEEPIQALIPPVLTDEMRVLARPLPELVKDDTKPTVLAAAETLPAPAAAETPAPAAPPVKTPVRSVPAAGAARTAEVSSTPSGLQVIFDNDGGLVCRTPCALELPVGRHTLRLSGPGYRDELKIFQVAKDGAKLAITPAPLRGVVQIQSSKSGLSVMVNGEASGHVTPVQLSLPQGRYRITVGSVERAVEVKDGVISKLIFE